MREGEGRRWREQYMKRENDRPRGRERQSERRRGRKLERQTNKRDRPRYGEKNDLPLSAEAILSLNRWQFKQSI